MPRKVLVLGSTGSIGEQALDVISRSEELELCGISAGTNWEGAARQARETGVDRVALADLDAAGKARIALGHDVLEGEEGILELIVGSDPDLVLNAIVGTAGLGPTIVTLTEGIDLALANKESLVVGGALVTALAEATGARILPVDSEHSALFQLVGAEPPGTIDRLVVTASGGPFRRRGDLSGVTVEEALAHPTWEMGGRITIDSATLFNKGLEVIEAHLLFGLDYDNIEVLVHPQSLVHAMVHLVDGASLAHIGHADMRVPISFALHHPERADTPVPTLDLAEVGELTFEEPDEDRFPCLRLAREAGRAGGTAPCVLNAADEVAVAAFLGERIPFSVIPEVVKGVLDAMPAALPSHFDDLYAADAEARERARELIAGVGAAR